MHNNSVVCDQRLWSYDRMVPFTTIITSSGLWHCWLGQRNGIRPGKKIVPQQPLKFLLWMSLEHPA